jgi:hypothetical protein
MRTQNFLFDGLDNEQEAWHDECAAIDRLERLEEELEAERKIAAWHARCDELDRMDKEEAAHVTSLDFHGGER